MFIFIAADMRLHSVVENTEFKHVVKVLEGCCSVPSRVQCESNNESFVLFILVIYIFFLTTCQYLSALSVTVRIMANEPLLNVYIFQNK